MLKDKFKNIKVVTFEGIDGSGKGTQSELAVQKLQELGYKVLILDFPQYSDFFGKEIGYLLSGQGEVTANTLRSKDMSIWYALDRFKGFNDLNLDINSEIDFIILNRSTFSNMAYQTTRISDAEKEEFLNWLHQLEFEELGLPIPTKVFLFNITKDISDRNVKMKDARDYLDGQEQDVYESNGNMLEKAGENYLYLAKKYPDIFEKIDCLSDGDMLSIEEIHNLVMDSLLNM